MHILVSILLIIWLSVDLQARVHTLFDVERFIVGDDTRGPFSLGVKGLIPESDSLRVGDILLTRNIDYTIIEVNGSLVLTEPLLRGQVLYVTALRGLPVLPKVNRRSRPDRGEAKIVTAAARKRRPVSLDVSQHPDGGLTVNGVKRLAVSIGTSSEPALSQSLKLEVNGTVAEGVLVRGLLSDRSLPIQASGRTQSVQDLDRVRLEVSSPGFSAGLGDVNVSFDGTTFGRYRRHLQGARFQMQRKETEVDVFGAVSEGNWETRRITTQAGYQGPYGLSSSTRPIVAGSERLYLDGRHLKRGESQDYTINYDQGVITFMPSRPITGESRVTVEFQTVDPGGRIRSLGVRAKMATGNDRLRLGTTLIRESRGSLASSSSVGTPAPNTGAAPGAFLSSLDGAFTPSEALRVEGEIAWSSVSTDRLHAAGHAARLGLTVETRQAKEQTGGLRALYLAGTYRRISEAFRPFDRVDAVSGEGDWGWESSVSGDRGHLSEIAARYMPTAFITLGVEAGRRTGFLSGDRHGVNLGLDGGRFGQIQVSADRVSRSGGSMHRVMSSVTGDLGWVRPSIRYQSETTKGLAVRGSRLFYAQSVAGLPDGARVREVDLASEIGSEGVSLSSTLTVSQIDQLSGVWMDSVRVLTHLNRFSATTSAGLSFTGSFGQTARDDRSVKSNARLVNLGRVQIGYQPGSGTFSQQIQYKVSSTGLANRDHVFVSVPDGEGLFVWEDVNGDGLRDDEEYVAEVGGNYVPLYGVSTSFVPVRESSVGARTLVDFGRGQFKEVSLLKDVAFDVSVESERSGESDSGNGIFPWLHRFVEEGEGVLVARRNLRSTLHLFRRRRLSSVRLDASLSDNLDRRMSENGQTQIRGLTIFGKLRPRKGWDIEVRSEIKSKIRQGEGPFSHNITKRGFGLRNWLRLRSGWQTGLNLAWGRGRERSRDLAVRQISAGPEVRREFRGRGRLTGRLDWTSVSANDTVPLFLGLTDGKREGVNYQWRLGADYRVGQFVDAFFAYDGMVRPERPTLHVGRMELRATF